MRMKPPARTLLIEWDPRGIRRIADATPWWTRALIWLARALQTQSPAGQTWGQR